MRFLKFLYLSLLFCAFNIITFQSSNSMQSLLGPGAADLSPEDAKFIDDLLNSLPQEEKDKIFEEVNRFQQLSPQDQDAYLQDKFKEVEALSRNAPELSGPDAIENVSPSFGEPVFEAIKTEEKLSDSSKSQSTTSNLISMLEQLSSAVDSLLIKVKVLPRVSQQRKTEQDWLRLKSSLHDLESYIRIIQLQDKALKALSSDEYTMLQNNLNTLNKRLPQMVVNLDRHLPNTAGLTISFGEEDLTFDKDQVRKAQDILSNIIDFLTNNLEEKNVNESLKSLLKKHAPEELKKKELPNPIEPFIPSQRSYTTQSFGGGGGYDYNPGYYPYRPSYGGADTSGGSTSGQPGTGGGLEAKDDSKKDKTPSSGGAGGGKGKGNAPDNKSKDKADDKDKSKDGKDNKDKDKKDKKDKKEDKKDKKDKGRTKTKKSVTPKKRTKYPNTELDNFLKKLDEYLADVSNTIDKSTIDKLLKDEDNQVKDDFKKAFMLYDNYILKLSDGIAKRSQYLQQPAKDLLMKSINEIYNDPDYELDKIYKKVINILPVLEEDKKNQRKILEDLFSRMYQLRLNLGLEKPAPEPIQDNNDQAYNPDPSHDLPPIPGADVDKDGNINFN